MDCHNTGLRMNEIVFVLGFSDSFFFFFFFFFFLRSFSPQSEFFGVQAGTALYRSTRYIEASTNEVGVYFAAIYFCK